jgi:hypothetical protein
MTSRNGDKTVVQEATVVTRLAFARRTIRLADKRAYSRKPKHPAQQAGF